MNFAKAKRDRVAELGGWLFVAGVAVVGLLLAMSGGCAPEQTIHVDGGADTSTETGISVQDAGDAQPEAEPPCFEQPPGSYFRFLECPGYAGLATCDLLDGDGGAINAGQYGCVLQGHQCVMTCPPPGQFGFDGGGQ